MYVLSLGAGVQSSALALMLARAEIGPMPECAIFADTQAEPDGVYEWLRWLERMLPYPIHRVTAGDLAKASTTVRTSATGTTYIKPMVPAYIDRPGQRGIAQRHCTLDYKIAVIHREIRRLRMGREVTQYIGISFDELHRMKPAQQPWMHNDYPLVERRLTRGHCLEWMTAQGFPTPPRSACVFCPYHSDAEWKRLRDEDPAAFASAVAYEQRLQTAYAQTPMGGVPYLHAARVPLATVEFTDDRQTDLFGNECEGMCGV